MSHIAHSSVINILPFHLQILLAHCLVTLAQQEVIVAIDEPGKTQYHEANFNTSEFA